MHGEVSAHPPGFLCCWEDAEEAGGAGGGWGSVGTAGPGGSESPPEAPAASGAWALMLVIEIELNLCG